MHSTIPVISAQSVSQGGGTLQLRPQHLGPALLPHGVRGGGNQERGGRVSRQALLDVSRGSPAQAEGLPVLTLGSDEDHRGHGHQVHHLRPAPLH